MKNMGKLLKQAQKMQSDMQKMQEEMAKKEFEVSVGGGMVKVVMTGDQVLKSVKISGDVAGDVEMIEDMVLTAVNKAHEDVKQAMESEMGNLTGGMGMPGMF